MKKIIPLLSFLFFTSISEVSFSQNAWSQQNSGITNTIRDIYAVDANNCFAVADTGKFLKTTNGGVNWTVTLTGLTYVNRVRFFDANTGIIATCKIYKTTNGGSNWFVIYDTGYCFSDVSTLNSNSWYFVGNIPWMIKTTNQGANWIRTNGGGGIYLNAVFFIDENTGWTCNANISNPQTLWISRSTNGGTDWTSQYSIMVINSGAVMWDIFFSSVNYGVCLMDRYVGSYRLRTTNSGVNWTVDTLQVPQYSLYFLSNGTGWSCGASGRVMKTTNNGGTWITEVTPVTSSLRSINFINANTGWAAGDNGVILKTTTGGITYIETINNTIPESFRLYQNYPNPFNPVTRIKFDVPSFYWSKGLQPLVLIRVYDILGREVATLVNEALKPGTYEVEWDGTNFPSGVHFYSIIAGDYAETRKMVLIK